MRNHPSRLALCFVFAALAACRSEGLERAAPPDGGLDTTRSAPSCSTYSDAASCAAAKGCIAFSCPQCSGGSLFVGCMGGDSPPLGCPGLACPPPACLGLTQSECELSEQCHAIYATADELSCTGCAPGFRACADGPARCSGQSCAVKEVVCSPGYHVGYEPNGCEEGCVRESACTFDKNDCRTNGCAPGLDCIQCASPAWECLSDCA